MRVWRNTRGQKWKCNWGGAGRNPKKTYRQKYNTTEQTLSKKVQIKVTNSATNATRGRIENKKVKNIFKLMQQFKVEQQTATKLPN